MENSAALKVRSYLPDSDEETVREWHFAHTGKPFAANLLPPVGVMVSAEEFPVAACWIYMSVGIGVCFVENPITAPGLTMGQARQALTHALDTLKAIAKANDYGAMIANTIAPIARYLKGLGFHRADDYEKVTLIALL